MIHLAHFVGAYLAGYLLYLPAIACMERYLDTTDDRNDRLLMSHAPLLSALPSSHYEPRLSPPFRIPNSSRISPWHRALPQAIEAAESYAAGAPSQW